MTHSPITIMIIPIVFQSLVLSNLIILVIPREDGEGRMVTESNDVRFCLRFDGS